ncbi:MAG TPA: DNA-3-methyladenine glycosylase [Thermoplasmatales archaeon]|nr:DNA-3-methyladenine glycosylase [Thermoplasmatales archaeon]
MLPKKFYNRDASVVAKELLGCIIVKKNDETLKGKIVETEAYYGLSDPASRAKNGRIGKIMGGEAGISFIYMVHGNWLFNVTTMPEGKASGILIRAVEPLKGVEKMKERRRRENIRDLTSGPGKFTQAFGIDNSYNGIKIYRRDSPIYIENKGKKKFEIVESYRIGVREDLPFPLRFYIKGNEFVSKL